MSDQRVARGRGRPSKFSREKAQAIFDLLAIGVTRRAAAEVNGVCLDTFQAWLRCEAETISDEDFSFFADGVRAAEAHAEIEFTKCVAAQAPRDWRAAESWLKRRRRGDYGDSVDQNIGGQPGNPVTLAGLLAAVEDATRSK